MRHGRNETNSDTEKFNELDENRRPSRNHPSRRLPLRAAHTRGNSGADRFCSNFVSEVAVGAASCYLRESFYLKRVFLEGESEKDVIVLLVKKARNSCDVFRGTGSRYAGAVRSLGVVAEAHRGLHLCEAVIALTETIGRSMGMGMAFGMATLHIPYMQIALEKLGFRIGRHHARL